MWAFIVEQAQKAHIPPWQFEAECTRYWFEAITAYHHEVNMTARRGRSDGESLEAGTADQREKPTLGAASWNMRAGGT